MTATCTHLWERRATEDVCAERLRYRCARCDVPGSKLFGLPESAIAALGEAAQKREHAKACHAWEDARAKRALEDPGYHPYAIHPPTMPGGIG